MTSQAKAARSFNKVMEILELHNRDRRKIIPILQAVQEEYRYLPQEVLTYIAVSLRMSPARLYGIATFYSHFSLEPKGKYIIKICDGTACHVKKSESLIQAINTKLNLGNGKRTTTDLLFTLETVSCLGACGLAPVVVVNEDVYSQCTPDKVNSILDEIIAKEQHNA